MRGALDSLTPINAPCSNSPPGGCLGRTASMLRLHPTLHFCLENVEGHGPVLEYFGMKFADIEARAQHLLGPLAQCPEFEFTYCAGERVPGQGREPVGDQDRK